MKSIGLILLTALICAGASAQTQAAPVRQRVTGTVASVDTAGGKITLKTDKGDVATVAVTEKSFLRRLPPGETDTKKAVPIALGDMAVGDRVVAIGQVGADQKSFDARTVYVMSKADVAQIHAKEEEDWQKRGTTGIVTEVNAAAKTIAIKAGRGRYTVEAAGAKEILRYAPDSAKLADARPATLADIRVGDELHVLGDKNADGTAIAAEELVSGSFRQIAATIEAADAAAGTLKVKDLATKKPVVLKVTSDTVIRKLPEQMAAFLARRYNAAAAGTNGGAAAANGAAGRGAGGNWQQGQAAGGAGRGWNGPGGAGGRGGGDIKQMLDHLPAVRLSELKRGDAIMVSTTEGTDGTHLTAIMMLAGVEPLLTASPNSTRDIMGGWNLGGGEGAGEGN